MTKPFIYRILSFIAAITSCFACQGNTPVQQEANGPTPVDVGQLILATTTSTDNSGLLDVILPEFEARYHADVEVIAVGTGQAIQLAQRGDADIILVHAPDRERAFIEAGYGIERHDIMYNDFVIVGPAADPAQIIHLSDVTAALTKIAETQSPFISRGDDSGTHIKEQQLWPATVTHADAWYQSVGQGMGATLTVASEQQAYTLTDRATFLARTQAGIDLEILVEGDPRLFNPYGVIAVNPNQHGHVNAVGAQTFIMWLASVETQHLIAQFGIEQFGQPLFIPDSAPWHRAQSATTQQ